MATGARFQEQDLSERSNVGSAGRQMMLLRTRKGDLQKPIEVRNWQQFLEKCGQPYSDNDDALIAKQFLDRGGILLVGRVVHASDPNNFATITAVKSSRMLQDRTTVASAAQITTAAGPFNIADQDLFDLIVDGVNTGGATFDAYRAHAQSTAITTGGPSGLDFTGGMVLNVRFGQNTHLTAVQFISLLDSDFADPTNATLTEIVTALNARLVRGHAEEYVSGGSHYIRIVDDLAGTDSGVQITGGTANALLGFSMSLQTPAPGSNCVDASAVTAAELKTFVDSLGLAVVTTVVGAALQIRTITTGVGATLSWDVGSTITAKLGLTIPGSVTGQNSTVATNTLSIVGKSHGVWADGIQFTIADSVDVPNTFNLTIPVQTGVSTAEVHKNLTMDSSDTVNYVVTVLASRSQVVDAIDQNSAKAIPYKNPQVGTYSLSGGNDGLASLSAADYIGGVTSKLGFYAFQNVSDSMDLHVPGLIDRVTAQQLGGLCEARGTVVYYFTFPNPAIAQDCIDYVNATGAYAGQGTRFNSSYMAGYFDRPIERDFSNRLRAVPSSGHVAAALVFNDTGGGKLLKDFGPWFAPAGEKRALIKSVGIEVNLGGEGSTDLRAQLEENQINLLVDFGDGKPQLWDQRTTYRANSALKELNVRRLLIHLKRLTVAASRSETWDPNDPTMWRAVYAKLDPILQEIKDKRGLYDYKIDCDQDASTVDDAVVQTPVDIDAGRFRCMLYLKPTKAAREIIIVGVITRTDAKFDEIVV